MERLKKTVLSIRIPSMKHVCEKYYDTSNSTILHNKKQTSLFHIAISGFDPTLMNLQANFFADISTLGFRARLTKSCEDRAFNKSRNGESKES